jgi:uncharacterized protein YndB with AHSA1/START domain
MRLPLSNVTEYAGSGNSDVSATISTNSLKSGRLRLRRTQEEELIMIPTTHEARIVQQFSHPVSLVYEAWTKPRHIEHWLRPAESIRLSVKEFNFREGGEYFFDYVWADGAKPVRGKFLRIVPEHRLIFSWVPQPPDPDAGAETMVSVFFRAQDENRTEVEVLHTLFPNAPMCDCHNQGWSGALTLLSALLSEGRPNNSTTH